MTQRVVLERVSVTVRELRKMTVFLSNGHGLSLTTVGCPSNPQGDPAILSRICAFLDNKQDS